MQPIYIYMFFFYVCMQAMGFTIVLYVCLSLSLHIATSSSVYDGSEALSVCNINISYIIYEKKLRLPMKNNMVEARHKLGMTEKMSVMLYIS